MIQVHAIGEFSNGTLHDVAHIRLFKPLSVLEQNDEISLSTGFDYVNHKDSDVFFIERTWGDTISYEKVYSLVDYIKSTKKKLIYEIDDNLLEVESLNSKQKSVIRMLAKAANLIIVSTEELKKRMSVFNCNIITIPNYLSLKNIKDRKDIINSSSKTIVIGYAGTFSHQKDFQMIKLPLMQILEKYKSTVYLEIIGSLSDKDTIRSLRNVKVIDLGQESQYDRYWKWMCENVHWDIGIAPLKKNEFTICKSDIKYLDYAALGIPGIYSNHPAYSKTVTSDLNGLLVQNTCDAWFSALELLITNDELREKMARNAQHDLYQNRLLENNADKWLAALKTVMDDKIKQ